ncbi:DUF1569 domain-containing protein [Geojedonia litorea]|uniref:DUF1569 domain-containing protein n=1 Tax=Geojedonia litorea TaxID=1268269 RepID=A0ABV9N1I3_9FLAO
MKSLFISDDYNEILNRINALNEHTQPQWGKMDVAQMLAHCCEPLKVPLGKLTLKKPNRIMRLLFLLFKESLYDDKPWKRSLPTTKEYKIVDDKMFTNEKTKLVELIHELHSKKDQNSWPPHPVCGQFTTEQWGKMQYKHLDHHLKQFGV